MSTKLTNPTKSKSQTSKKDAKKPRAYPSYHEMVKEAISALKERTGSSQVAIAKYVEEKQKNLPANFKKLLSVQLKKLVADGKLVKVKNSYKLPPKTASIAPAVKPAKKADAKPKPKPQTNKTKAVTAKKPSKAAPVKKKVKTPVKAAKKPKSIKSPAKVVKRTKKA